MRRFAVAICLISMVSIGKFGAYAEGLGDASSSVQTPPVAGSQRPSQSDVRQIKNPDTFVFVSPTFDPQSLDPAVAYSSASYTVLTNIYDTLIGFDPRISHFVPLLATEVPTAENGGISSDGRTYRFHIRNGIRFQNGDFLRPEDVAYSIKRSMVVDADGGPAWLWYSIFLDLNGSRGIDGNIAVSFDRIDSVASVEGQDVLFHLARPFAPFLSVMSQPLAAVLDKRWVIEKGGWDGSAATWQGYNNPKVGDKLLHDAVNGTGPYRLYRWERGNEIVLTRFGGYWGTLPSLEKAVIQFQNEFSVRKLMLLRGDADVIVVAPTFYPEMNKMDRVKSVSMETLQIDTFLFNFEVTTERNPYTGSGKLDGEGIPSDFFADRNVRLGIAYAWDEKRFLKDAANNYGVDPVSLVPYGVPHRKSDLSRNPFDLDKAAELFHKAWNGKLWDIGFDFDLAYKQGDKVRQIAAGMLSENLRKINPLFHVMPRPIERSQYLNALSRNQLPIIIVGWVPEYLDPDAFVTPFAASWGIFPKAQGYHNDEMDRLIREARTTTDLTVRQQDYDRIQELYLEEMPGLIVCQPVKKIYFRDWLKGAAFSPLQSTPLDSLRWLSKGY